ncbi:MAPEG family protein [Halomonas sp. DP8Y7-3]|uniref:MAPEG family protein n=1 Tax=Halomonas sp. DP8Y7-3 TaxID=2859079 RepID=UPI001C97F6B8|nr:MAPEG family protein [Halomonas sp. DP8Y7-3]MBY5930742.1 MAPEG family protein [Halomonas sp. DP8Y7-3]
MSIFLVTLFIASLLPILLAWIGAAWRVRQFGHLDNRHPRAQQAVMEGIGARLHAAQSNAWEALIVYLSTAVVAMGAGADLNSLDMPALVFLASRLLHPIAYALDWQWIRSGVFAIGMLACLVIMIGALW